MDNSDWEMLTGFISRATGLTIPPDNCAAVKRFVKKKTSQMKGISEYLTMLEKNNTELHELIKTITIHETYFFREEKYFRLIDEVFLPEYAARAHYAPLMWSAAAATGEEAFSLALLSFSRFRSARKNCPRVIATDIDSISLEQIRSGSYRKNSFRSDGKSFHPLVLQYSEVSPAGHVPGDYPLSYPELREVTIKKEIRDAVDVRPVNLIRDNYSDLLYTAPYIILLCNVLIYMSAEHKDLVIDRAARVLEAGGYLILSSVNTAFVSHPLLELCEYKDTFYFKKK